MLWQGDITKLKVDAIVNASHSSLLVQETEGSGVDRAIHRVAGKLLVRECATLGGCKTGDAKITKGYNLPAKTVIHTSGPVYHRGKYIEKQIRSCYRRCMELCDQHNLHSVAFCMISCGLYRYPVKEAALISLEVTSEYLQQNKTSSLTDIIFTSFTNNNTYLFKQVFEGKIHEEIKVKQTEQIMDGEDEGEKEFNKLMNTNITLNDGDLYMNCWIAPRVPLIQLFYCEEQRLRELYELNMSIINDERQQDKQNKDNLMEKGQKDIRKKRSKSPGIQKQEQESESEQDQSESDSEQEELQEQNKGWDSGLCDPEKLESIWEENSNKSIQNEYQFEIRLIEWIEDMMKKMGKEINRNQEDQIKQE